MSKLMTIDLLFQRLKDGRVKLTDTFPVSERAWRAEGSRMFIDPKMSVPIEDLLKGMIVQSGNDATVALAEYQAIREIDVIRLQNAAWNAMEWFEVCGERYCDRFEPEQLMYAMLTRSQRISHENLRLRDQGYQTVSPSAARS